MSGDLALLIPITALSIPIVAIWTKHKRSLAEMAMSAGAGQHAQISSETAQRIKALEDRVRVLERIVTDANANGSLTRAHEIAALRGSEPAPAPAPAKTAALA